MTVWKTAVCRDAITLIFHQLYSQQRERKEETEDRDRDKMKRQRNKIKDLQTKTAYLLFSIQIDRKEEIDKERKRQFSLDETEIPIIT